MTTTSASQSARDLAARRNPTHYAGDLRRELLDRALDVIAREGPAAVSLRALSRSLGVSHAAPARHFPDKAGLFTALAIEGFRMLGERLREAAAATGPDAPAVARFGATGRAYAHFGVEHRAHFEVMWRHDLLRDDPELDQAAGEALAILLEGVGAAQREGWAAGADLATVAQLAWSSVHGLAVLWTQGPLARQAAEPFDAVVARVVALLGDALAALPPTDPEEKP
jgi:AcrR family transcriptional regulator